MDTNVRVPSLGLGMRLATLRAFGTIAWQHLLHSWGSPGTPLGGHRAHARKIRMISVAVLALVVGLAMLSPTPAVGQQTRLIFGDDQGVFVPASDYQLIRVTIGNPHLPAPTADRNATSFVVQFDRPIDPVTIAPGESFTYTLDPREVGAAVDPRPGLRHVRVSFRFKVEVLEGQSAPRPTLTIEVLNRKTGALESFVAFPGFAGGVVVAAGD